MTLGLEDIREFDFVEEVKRTSLAFYQQRSLDRRELASQTSSAKQKERLLRLANDDEARVELLKERFMEEGINLDEYDPQETEAIVNSLVRHVTQPAQKDKKDDTEKTENEKVTARLLRHVGQ